MEHLFIATVNTPGYLPEGEPGYFTSATEAWDWLRGERYDALDDAEVDPDTDATVATLRSLSDGLLWDELGEEVSGAGSVGGTTPGYDGDHDLGVVYSVTAEPIPNEPDSTAYAHLGRMVCAILGSSLEWDSSYMESIAEEAERLGMPAIGGQKNTDLALWRRVADEEGVGHDDDWAE
jgi:hypothetical protein